MKGFYVPHYEYIREEVKVGNRTMPYWYRKIGREVDFSHLDFDKASKFLSRGFAPAIPLEHGISCGSNTGWKDNYVYPISFGDISDIPF
jgi:hypothetical protein